MRLAELIADLPVEAAPGASLEADVRRVQHDSRQVGPGDLFVAIRGARFDGREYAVAAADQGAVAVLAEGESPAGLEVPWLVCPEPRALLGPLSARLTGRPDRELRMIGVTGTNGKSTTVWLVHSVLEAAGIPTGKLGTVESQFRGVPLASARTTPEAPELYRTLRALRERGAAATAMEVSSHSLVLGRVSEVLFDVGVLTNLTRDHLDFHGSMEEYFAAKRRLFAQLKPGGRSVVNAADPYGRRLAGELDRVVSFGRGGDVDAVDHQLGVGGIEARVRTPRGELVIQSPLFGSHNLENVLAAIAVGEALDLPHAAMREGVASLAAIPGRMEPVRCGQPFPIFLDYAHTDDALRRLLGTVREITGRRIVSVFGVQGERDQGKRPLMGRAAGEVADLVILTTDNPRSEDPAAIAAALASGVEEAGHARWEVVLDREEALARAVDEADEESIVLVTGKGHETGQEVAGEKLPFSDREALEAVLAERGWSARPEAGRAPVPG